MKTEVGLPFTLNFPEPGTVAVSSGVGTNLVLTATLREACTRSQGSGGGGERPSSWKHVVPRLMKSKLTMSKISRQSRHSGKQPCCIADESLRLAVSSHRLSVQKAHCEPRSRSVWTTPLATPAFTPGGPGVWCRAS